MIPVTLTIAGSDPSGGAGIQADLKTFHQHRTFGTSVITLLTVQNTVGVTSVQMIRDSFIVEQLASVLEDIPPAAAKTGALGNAETIEALLSRVKLFDFPLVVDPVMVSKHGARLLDDDGAQLLKRRFLEHAYLVTPNLAEAEILSERSVTDVSSMERAAASIRKLGVRNVLIKGGHLSDQATDVLLMDKEMVRLPGPRYEGASTHGTGCVLSAAITAHIAAGKKIGAAVTGAKRYVSEAIRTAPGLGKGIGPLNMHAQS